MKPKYDKINWKNVQSDYNKLQERKLIFDELY